NDTIVLSRSDDYADMQLAFALRHSDNASKANSLLITVSICPQTTRRDRMFRRRDFAAPNDHRGVVRICYDTYLGETTGRHFTYFSQGYSQNIMLIDNAVNDYTIEHSIEPSSDLTNDVTGDEIVSADRTDDVASDNSADITAVAAVTNNIVKNEVKKEDKAVSIWQRIFGRQRPKHDFDELPGTKMIDHECEFFRFAVPFVMSGERPNSPTLYLWTKGAWLTEPTRIFFANWKSGNTEGIYRVRDGEAFGQFPYQREDSAAFFEYVIPNMKDDETIDITAGVSIVPNITFSQSMLEILPDVSDDVIVSDVTSDSEMDRLLNGINNQLNSKNDVRQSGVDRTQNMLDEIKKR
ncbi:MAG: hypothetical protein J6W76_01195, partial [Spirochaetales bacterium]|nr:hypothetical protein [Spirochaetales bacterium]